MRTLNKLSMSAIAKVVGMSQGTYKVLGSGGFVMLSEGFWR